MWGGVPDLIGLGVLKGGLNEVYYVTCANVGNADAGFATVWLEFPSYVTWQSGLTGTSITAETVGPNTLLGVDFISIPAGGASVIPIILTAPTDFSFAHQMLGIDVWNGR